MKKRILIVEDEPSIADNLTYALKTEGFEPIWKDNGQKAREFLSQSSADLIVLDVGLPDINGFELCKEIRRTWKTPVIFLTARSEEVDRVVGLEIGADDYMVKPFSPRELAARVKAVLRRTTVDTPSPATAGPFSIEEDRRRICYHGTPLSLSRYEYRILKVFLERPGRVLTRDQLMELAWDDPGMSLDRTVDAHIKSLRAKLKQIRPKEDPIITHRGEGYSLREIK
jgi:two-component system catabolic regulation response regulator CreB